MPFGNEETGRDQESLVLTGLIDLFLHPRQRLGRQVRLLDRAFGHALAHWMLAGGEQGHGKAGLVNPEP